MNIIVKLVHYWPRKVIHSSKKTVVHSHHCAPDLCCGRTAGPSSPSIRRRQSRAPHSRPPGAAREAARPLERPHRASRRGEGRPFSVGDVNGILNFFRLQHYAASPAVQTPGDLPPQPSTSWLPDTEIRSLFGPEAVGQPACFFCAVGENHIVISRRDDGPMSSISDLRTPDEMKQMLSVCLDAAATAIGNSKKGSSYYRTFQHCTGVRAHQVSEGMPHGHNPRSLHQGGATAASLPHKSLHRHLRGDPDRRALLWEH